MPQQMTFDISVETTAVIGSSFGSFSSPTAGWLRYRKLRVGGVAVIAYFAQATE
jgi:hypothetical protein